jgi:hypothetical protein
MYKISAQSDIVMKSYRVYGRADTLTDSRVYSLFEYTKSRKKFERISFSLIDDLDNIFNYFSFYRLRKRLNKHHYYNQEMTTVLAAKVMKKLSRPLEKNRQQLPQRSVKEAHLQRNQRNNQLKK